MRLLLDTHVALWMAVDRGKVPLSVRKLIADRRNEVRVSVASILEVMVKSNRGPRPGIPFSGRTAIEAFSRLEFQLLDISAHHLLAFEGLAVAHTDPFDRLVLAQALAEDMQLITKDARLSGYSDTIISW